MKETNPDLKHQLKDVPKFSGIYMMLNKKGEVIYIGKALNLKSRLRTYFNVASWKDRPKLGFMMPKVHEIRTVVTKSEKEALILEANLVYKYQPRYNVTLKDDKKFPWLMITYDENYPHVLPIRDVAGFRTKFPNTKNKFFGPYSAAGAMWETYKLLKESFPLRIRKKPLFKDRPCMNYHIGLCPGPCQNLISHSEYKKTVEQTENFLLGKYDVVLNTLKNQMKTASKELQYEKAARIRDTINKIKKVLEKQIVVSDDIRLSQDIFACDFQDNLMVLELVIVRDGKVISFEPLIIKIPKTEILHTNSQQEKIKKAFSEGIKQYYAGTTSNMPKEIIVEYELHNKDYIKEWLKAVVICPKRGKRLELIKMAKQNAKLALQKLLISNDNSTEAVSHLLLQELQNKLELKNYPKHIECFDISHLSGTNTVGSMVCFMEGKPEKTMYRKYNLKTVLNKIDDFQAMKEIVSRRYFNNGTTSLPALIIIDGGKGQLNTAKEALQNVHVDLNKIDLISLAKKEEEIFKPDKKGSIILDKSSKVLHLLQRIRDEAHRFAITFQKEKRRKELQ